MQPRYADSGVFIAFEGGEGAGKSTQAGLLASWLRERGHDVLLTREPGGTQIGEGLRNIVLDTTTGALSARTEALLYAADKAEHVDAVIEPALQAGTVVITDRYVDSALAYQGAGRDLAVDEVERVNRWATAQLRPHLTIVLDVEPQEGLARFEGADRIEAEPLAFHQRVRQGFLELASRDPQHFLVIGAAEAPDDIHHSIIEAVEPLLERVGAAR